MPIPSGRHIDEGRSGVNGCESRGAGANVGSQGVRIRLAIAVDDESPGSPREVAIEAAAAKILACPDDRTAEDGLRDSGRPMASRSAARVGRGPIGGRPPA